MKYSFDADSIDIGIDDTEEFYSIQFTQNSPTGGPAENYLVIQRSVEETSSEHSSINTQPYIEFNDPSNGRFARSFSSISLCDSQLEIIIEPGSGVVTHPGLDESTSEINELVVNFKADPKRLRKLRLALELVIADGIRFDVVTDA
jgi:hypothetical protein